MTELAELVKLDGILSKLDDILINWHEIIISSYAVDPALQIRRPSEGTDTCN